MDSSQLTIYGESDDESEDDKSEQFEDEEEETIVAQSAIDETVIPLDEYSNNDVTPVPIPPPSPDYSSNRTNSNSFECDSLDQIDETEYFSIDKSASCDDMFPSTTVDSGRASLSTAALKRLSEESLRAISPITKEVQSSTIVEEEEPIDRAQLISNLKIAQDALLKNMDAQMAKEVISITSAFSIAMVDKITKS